MNIFIQIYDPISMIAINTLNNSNTVTSFIVQMVTLHHQGG